MFKKLGNFYKKWRLNHHDCEKHFVACDSYTTSYTAPDSGMSAEWQVIIGHCKICGKRIDID